MNVYVCTVCVGRGSGGGGGGQGGIILFACVCVFRCLCASTLEAGKDLEGWRQTDRDRKMEVQHFNRHMPDKGMFEYLKHALSVRTK